MAESSPITPESMGGWEECLLEGRVPSLDALPLSLKEGMGSWGTASIPPSQEPSRISPQGRRPSVSPAPPVLRSLLTCTRGESGGRVLFTTSQTSELHLHCALA